MRWYADSFSDNFFPFRIAYSQRIFQRGGS
nr:MAG TPA: hypothetical protein [Caudoviricetes sp.]